MKKVLALVALNMFASSLWAQTSTMSSPTTSANISGTQGVRVALVAPILKIQVKLSALGESVTSERESLDNSLGFSIGYAQLPVQALGFTTGLTYMNLHKDSTDLGNMRLDGNLGVAANDFINFKAGLNFSKIVTGEAAKYWTPGLGFQASMGLQMNRNLGLDIGYTKMTQNAEESGVRATLDMSGPEIALTGTF